MRTQVERHAEEAEKTVGDIRRATRRQYSAEEKVRTVIAGLRGEESIAEVCRKEGINQNLYYRWSKEFLEAGEKRLSGDTAREATSDEVKGLRAEAQQLKGAAGRGVAAKPPAEKKRDRRWGVRFMRYSVAEKLEISRLVEQSSLPIRRTLVQMRIPALRSIVGTSAIWRAAPGPGRWPAGAAPRLE
jgi:putative transposase